MYVVLVGKKSHLFVYCIELYHYRINVVLKESPKNNIVQYYSLLNLRIRIVAVVV
jgi:hypothetical protein